MNAWNSMSPSAKGAVSEAGVLAALSAAGHRVLIPWGPQPYDLVIEEGGVFKKVQVKTARLGRGGSVLVVAAARHSVGTDGTHKVGLYSKDEIDVVAAYYPAERRCFLIPVESLPASGSLHLRLTPSKNGQTALVRKAAEYEIV